MEQLGLFMTEILLEKGAKNGFPYYPLRAHYLPNLAPILCHKMAIKKLNVGGRLGQKHPPISTNI